MNSINRIPFFRERTRNTGIISCSVCLEEFQTPITCILFTKQKEMSVFCTMYGVFLVKRIRADTYNQSINVHLKSNDKTIAKNYGIISVGKSFLNDTTSSIQFSVLEYVHRPFLYFILH